VLETGLLISTGLSQSESLFAFATHRNGHKKKIIKAYAANLDEGEGALTAFRVPNSTFYEKSVRWRTGGGLRISDARPNVFDFTKTAKLFCASVVTSLRRPLRRLLEHEASSRQRAGTLTPQRAV